MIINILDSCCLLFPAHYKVWVHNRALEINITCLADKSHLTTMDLHQANSLLKSRSGIAIYEENRGEHFKLHVQYAANLTNRILLMQNMSGAAGFGVQATAACLELGSDVCFIFTCTTMNELQAARSCMVSVHVIDGAVDTYQLAGRACGAAACTLGTALAMS